MLRNNKSSRLVLAFEYFPMVGRGSLAQLSAYFMVGIEKSDPALIPVGQRAACTKHKPSPCFSFLGDHYWLSKPTSSLGISQLN